MKTRNTMTMLAATAGVLTLTATALSDHQLAPDERGWANLDATINNAAHGDTIRLAPGEYKETIEATENADCKTLRIVGDGKDPTHTVIRASCSRHRFGGFGLDADRELNYVFENLTFAGHECSDRHPDRDGLWFSRANVQFINCRFERIQSLYLDDVDQNPNEYDTYGAVYLDSSTADFDNCTFYENGLAFARLTDYTCKAEGGAIHSYNSNVTISDSDFEANYAVSRGHATARATSRSAANGGAIYAVKGRMSISGTRFHENEASSYASTSQPDEILGGAIYAVNLDRFTVTGCEFRHNAAEWAGGAVDGPRGYGGAIYVNYWETFPFNGPGGTLLADNHFYWNKTDFTGGAVFVGEEAQVKIKRCEFECNTLEQAAGPWRDAGGNEFIEDCGPPCRGDLNGDGVVDKFDLFVIYSLWGKVKSYKQYAADLNYDGVVNASDILAWTRLATDCPPENDEPFGQ